MPGVRANWTRKTTGTPYWGMHPIRLLPSRPAVGFTTAWGFTRSWQKFRAQTTSQADHQEGASSIDACPCRGCGFFITFLM